MIYAYHISTNSPKGGNQASTIFMSCFAHTNYAQHLDRVWRPKFIMTSNDIKQMVATSPFWGQKLGENLTMQLMEEYLKTY